MICSSQGMEGDRLKLETSGHFFLLYPPKNLKNQNLKKLKQNYWRYHHFTHHNHMMYIFQGAEYDWQNFLSFWAIFCTFTPLTTQKVKTLKKWKKTTGNIILHLSAINNDHMYGSWVMEHDKHDFLFCTIFCPFTPQPKKSKLWKNEKNTWCYHHFLEVYQNHDHRLYLRYDNGRK